MKHLSIRKTIALLFALTAICAVIPLNPAIAETATVRGGWLILRSEPSFSGAAMASYPSGTVVTITGQRGAWYAVVTPDGRTGYMLGDYLKFQGNSSGKTSARVTSQNGLNVRLRSGPGTGYTVMGSYAPGTQVTVLSAGKDWSKIQIGNYTGYMMSKYLTTGSSGGTSQEFKPVSLPVPSEYAVWVTSRNGKGVNLRSGPSQYYASIGFYGIGTEATMISLGNTWSYIRIGEKYGYMMTQFLTTTMTTGGSSVVPVQGDARVVSANGKDVNLRAAPGLDSKVIRTYPAGTPLTIITRGEDWYFIHIGDDYGYMMKSFIRE